MRMLVEPLAVKSPHAEELAGVVLGESVVLGKVLVSVVARSMMAPAMLGSLRGRWAADAGKIVDWKAGQRACSASIRDEDVVLGLELG